MLLHKQIGGEFVLGNYAATTSKSLDFWQIFRKKLTISPALIFARRLSSKSALFALAAFRHFVMCSSAKFCMTPCFMQSGDIFWAIFQKFDDGIHYRSEFLCAIDFWQRQTIDNLLNRIHLGLKLERHKRKLPVSLVSRGKILMTSVLRRNEGALTRLESIVLKTKMCTFAHPPQFTFLPLWKVLSEHFEAFLFSSQIYSWKIATFQASFVRNSDTTLNFFSNSCLFIHANEKYNECRQQRSATFKYLNDLTSMKGNEIWMVTLQFHPRLQLVDVGGSFLRSSALASCTSTVWWNIVRFLARFPPPQHSETCDTRL